MTSRDLRLVIAGGGTGGHVLPAIAVVEELRRRAIPLTLLWIGSHDGVEGQMAEAAGIPFRAVQTGKLRRYLAAKTVTDAVRLPIGAAQSWRTLRAFKPDVVLSTGGFVSVPTVAAAARIAPILTHEQTAVLGLANRINARFADSFAVSHAQTLPAAAVVHKRVVVTGNPVRASLSGGDATRGRSRFGFTADLPLLYVTGGVRGASPLNDRVKALLPALLDACQILHQTGPAAANDDAATLTTLRSTWPEHFQARYKVVEVIGDEMADLYAAADLVLCRAGAGTVAEVASYGPPAIFIPLPGAGGDEQTKNARLLADLDAAVLLPQASATPDALRAAITSLLSDPGHLAAMRHSARTVTHAGAAARLADELLRLAGR